MTRVHRDDLTDGGVRLRPATEADVAAITRICQDVEIQRWNRVPSPYSESDARHWVAESRRARDHGEGFEGMLAVDAATDAVLGAMGVAVDPRDLVGEVAYWVAPDARGRGVATHGTRLVCRLAFAQLDAQRLTLLAAVDNPASNRVALRLGFTHEGVLRSRMLVGPTGDPSARRTDANVYGLLPGELT